MPMPLDQWRNEVSHHLDLIEAGADMCARHAEALPLRAGFPTKAEAEMIRCEAVLATALAKLQLAQVIYRDKRVDE